MNVSSGERLTVARIAEIVCDGLGVPDAVIEYTGSERGWAGDVVATDLDISLLKKFGWNSLINLEEGVKLYLQWIVGIYGAVKY